MARIQQVKRFKIIIDGLEGDNPILITRKPTIKEHQEFLNKRFEIGVAEARCWLMDQILTGCENVQIQIEERWIELNPKMPGWVEWIDPVWKCSVAPHFEEKAALPIKDEKNSDGPSA
ncbi:MAG TPA: hypothetical protein VIL61_09115 [Nitrospiria bacterium]